MDEEHSASQVSWGARINKRERQDEKDCPAWVKVQDRETWVQRGLILLQKETRHIFKLFATYALQLLDDLHSDDAWKAEGIVVGQPVIHFTWGEKGDTSEPGLHNPIHLSPRQTRSLLRLLERQRPALEEMRAQEEQERDRVMKEVARIVVESYLRSKTREGMMEDSSTD